MSAIALPIRYTPDDLLRMPNTKGFELVDGRLVEKNVSEEAGWISGKFTTKLNLHCDATNLGWVYSSEASYQIFPGRPNLIRKPDVSFIRRERHTGRFSRGHTRIAPDLLIEVVSPNDEADALDAKLQEFLDAGVRLI